MPNVFIDFVKQSSLSDEDKTLWDILNILEDQQITILSDFVNNDHDKLVFLTENLKMKQKLLEDYDEKVANNMMRAVAEQLTSLED